MMTFSLRCLKITAIGFLMVALVKFWVLVVDLIFDFHFDRTDAIGYIGLDLLISLLAYENLTARRRLAKKPEPVAVDAPPVGLNMRQLQTHKFRITRDQKLTWSTDQFDVKIKGEVADFQQRLKDEGWLIEKRITTFSEDNVETGDSVITIEIWTHL